RYLYDGLSRVLKTTWPDSTTQKPVVTTNAPTFFDNTTIDPSGNHSKITKDVNGRMISSANLLKSGGWLTTKYHYDPLSLVVTDPMNNAETTTYDSLGRVTKHSSLDMGTTTNLVYDGLDELLGSTHSSGAVTTIGYDAL